jgi:hypothetical protein
VDITHKDSGGWGLLSAPKQTSIEGFTSTGSAGKCDKSILATFSRFEVSSLKGLDHRTHKLLYPMAYLVSAHGKIW